MKRWSEWVVWSQIDAGNTGNHFSGGTCRFHLPPLVEDGVPDLFRPAIKRCVSLPHRQRPSATMALPARRLCLPLALGAAQGFRRLSVIAHSSTSTLAICRRVSCSTTCPSCCIPPPLLCTHRSTPRKEAPVHRLTAMDDCPHGFLRTAS